MFRGILPSKRISSSDFTMVTPLVDINQNIKENYFNPAAFSKSSLQPTPKTNPFGLVSEKRKSAQSKGLGQQDTLVDALTMNNDFERLLDDLQIPSNLRPKLVAMDASVKAAMLKSSHVMGAKGIPLSSTPYTGALRKTRSSELLGSPKQLASSGDYDSLEPPPTAALFGSSLHQPSSTGGSHFRGASFDSSRRVSRGQIRPSKDGAPARLTKDKGFQAGKNISPTRFISMLSGTSSTQLEVESIKKLRLLLRNESATWSQDFMKSGGYAALLTRLNEILEVEWREEQHDDQILHELLRCFKALSTSDIGCFALRSSCPTPFVQLMALLYSDKKPGDVATRQLIIELLLILFELYPPASLPSTSKPYGGLSRPRREAWDTRPATPPAGNVVTLPSPHKTLFSLIRALLLTPAPPPSESLSTPISPHAFIESLHRPRIYKTYLGELSDLCRDYFWAFCHPNNTVWVLAETDETCAEKPKAPGGMTGGVEFEAIGYFTTHLKLINAIARNAQDLDLPKEHDHSAYRFHTDLFLSGIERIILISRKASTTYYPTLHLEIARYISLACSAGFELPWTVSRLIGPPPPGMRKNPMNQAQPVSGSRPVITTPNKNRYVGPALPSPVRVEPIRFE